MNLKYIPENPYLLLTPGPLSTSKTVRAALLKDWCTWDKEYNSLIQDIRKSLVLLGTKNPENYTSVLMQGSGTFSVESVIGTVLPSNGKLLVLSNGAYGDRIYDISKVLKIDSVKQDNGETSTINLNNLEEQLKNDSSITHVAVVHCETTTGILNDIKSVSDIVKKYNKIFIVDAMSSFGGIPIDIEDLQIDFLISSANKCIQGVPGFGFIIAKKNELKKCEGNARSLSLDLYDQWKVMEENNGKFRYTSPTHVIHAFYQALEELKLEGGISERFKRYSKNQKTLVEGMKLLGFEPLLPDDLHSPIITSFYYPGDFDFTFDDFYSYLKKNGFVIYPGKISKANTFRIGNIGEVYPDDFKELLEEIKNYIDLNRDNKNN